VVFGGTRPEDNHPDGSHWRFFGSNGRAASGHAFIGGITFLNAAELTDNVPLKSALYVASVLPAWSRIIQDKHYLSQAILGWWLAYLSTRAVELTDQTRQSNVILAPVAMEDGGLGIGLLGAW
jgi:membrane-associated phospholipid phosphatase